MDKRSKMEPGLICCAPNGFMYVAQGKGHEWGLFEWDVTAWKATGNRERTVRYVGLDVPKGWSVVGHQDNRPDWAGEKEEEEQTEKLDGMLKDLMMRGFNLGWKTRDQSSFFEKEQQEAIRDLVSGAMVQSFIKLER